MTCLNGTPPTGRILVSSVDTDHLVNGASHDGPQSICANEISTNISSSSGIGIDMNPQAMCLARDRTGLDLRIGDEKILTVFRDHEFDLVFTISVLGNVTNVDDICNERRHVTNDIDVFLK